MKVMKNIPRLIMLAVLTLIAVVFVIPIFYSVFNSFKSQKEILSTTMTFFPGKLFICVPAWLTVFGVLRK